MIYKKYIIYVVTLLCISLVGIITIKSIAKNTAINGSIDTQTILKQTDNLDQKVFALSLKAYQNAKQNN